uniref:polymorphic toxin type 50 domain-containing protein n=1 Tax=Helicobacter suis TaxID=104628 RepID=UPI001F081F06
MHDSAARHLAFDGVCLARKDPYWNTHTPPLDWGCRCQLHMVSKRGLKAFNESRGTKIEILEKAPSNLPAVDLKIAFEPNTYKYLQNFFKAKLESYAGNNQAKEKLSGVLKAIEEKKRRFKELVGLTKEVNKVVRLATLDQAPIMLKGSTLQANPKNDLFDFFLAKEVIEKPLLIATKERISQLLGQKLGRWYQIEISGTELVGLQHFTEAPALDKGFQLAKLDFEKFKERPLFQESHVFSQMVLDTLKSIVNILALSPQQAKHILGGDSYIQGRSYYKKAPTIEQIRQWIKDSLEIRLNKNESAWDKHGVISHPDFEGFVITDSEIVKVFQSKLHWNKKGIHIVPVRIDH